LWNQIKPDYVITHDGPQWATRNVMARDLKHPDRQFNIIPTRTGQLLDQMFEYHKPKIWIFGHYHVGMDKEINGTRFICLPELGEITLDIPSISR